MLRRYNGYGGIRRSLTRLHPSKQFGPHATMTSSAMPTPWYCPPPFLDNIWWWDDFYWNPPSLLLPRSWSSTPITLLRLKPMVWIFSTSVHFQDLFWLRLRSRHLPCFKQQDSKIVIVFSFTDFHHFHLLKEDHDKQNGDNGSILQEPLPQYHKQPHNKLRETKVCIG